MTLLATLFLPPRFASYITSSAAFIGISVALIGGPGCGNSDVSNYSLGAESYPGFPDCKQVYFNTKPIPGVFLKQLTKAKGGRLEGVACHEKNVVVDALTGRMTQGN